MLAEASALVGQDHPVPDRQYPGRCRPVLAQGRVVGCPLTGAPGAVAVLDEQGAILAIISPHAVTRGK